MSPEDKNLMEQILEIDGLRLNLKEVEEMLLAIRSGEVDALVIRGGEGEQVRALQGADHPFRVLVDAMNEGAVLLDLEGLILYSNSRFSRMVGKDPGELIGLKVLSFLSPGAGPESDLVGAVGAGQSPCREISLVRPDGQPLEVRITLSRFHVDGVSLLCLVATDLADERKMERTAAAERRAAFLARAGALLASSLEYEFTIQGVARISVPVLGDWCWVHVLDDAGMPHRLAVAHRDPGKAEHADRIFHRYPPTRENAPLLHEVLGSGEPALFGEIGPDFFDRYAANPEIRDALRQLQLRSLMIVPLVARGRVLGTLSFAKEESGVPFRPEDLELARELASRAALAVDNARLHLAARRANEDLERRVKERTRELEDSVRELEAFTYTVAHDLRAPLRAIVGCSEIIVQDYADLFASRPELADYFGRITSGATKMDALINDLLSFSRLSRSDLKLEVLPLEAAVTEAKSRLGDEVAKCGGRVDVDLPLPRVRGHRSTIVQVVFNLLSNALKFVRPGDRPEVRITAQTSGNRVTLRVQDNGIGIDPAFRDRIFGVFERLNQSEHYPGTGIGLAIVRRAVERMGGTCGMESEPGKGSCFWVELSAATPDA
jgi:PAS domain S-box-containing protein